VIWVPESSCFRLFILAWTNEVSLERDIFFFKMHIIYTSLLRIFKIRERMKWKKFRSCTLFRNVIYDNDKMN